MSRPKISINMGTYNDEEYISQTVESLLNQTFNDFELLIVDDGSTDNTPSILSKYAKLDDRIKIITNPINLGRPKTFNKLIKESKADIIARMDADDLCSFNRLEQQYNFLLNNKDISLCGSFVVTYETSTLVKLPCSNDSIRSLMPFMCPIVHPSTMYRKSHIINSAKGYAEDLPCAEDYELWARLSFDPKIKFANLPEPLLTYRLHPEKRESRIKYLQQIEEIANAIRLMVLKKIIPSITPEEITAHTNISTHNLDVSYEELENIELWLRKLQSAVSSSGYCDPRSFKFTLNNIYKHYSKAIKIKKDGINSSS